MEVAVGDGGTGAASQGITVTHTGAVEESLRPMWISLGRAMLYTLRHHGQQNQTVISNINPKSKLKGQALKITDVDLQSSCFSHG